ncbi:MAG: transglutaminase domain-containing protein [Chlamydiia bacterium]|nr:transglutaminase domain-containing protein [Chlamydiia bacterium]
MDSSSLTQFRALYEDGAPVWCTNIARIYCALANLTGLPTREVNAAGLYDGIQFTGHAFAESYLREQQTWVFVDVASGKAMVTTMDDRPLNSVQLWQQTQLAEDQPALLAWVYRDGTITQTPYAEARWSEQEYFGPNTDLLFPPPKSYPLSFMEKGYHYLLQTNRVWSADPTSLFARQTLQQLMRLGLLLSSSTILILSLLRFNRRNLESK